MNPPVSTTPTQPQPVSRTGSYIILVFAFLLGMIVIWFIPDASEESQLE